MANALAIEVRIASRDDEGTVLELFRRHEQHRAGDRGADSYFALFDREVLLERLGDNHSPWVVLALSGDQAVGIATVEIRAGRDVRHATLRCLFGLSREDPSIEEVLVSFARQMAIEQGCNALDIEVLPGDQHVKSVLEEAGFKARLLTMHQSLGDR